VDSEVLDNTIVRLARTALASFLVLFLEVALIRWMPAHVRLLSFFSNFILLGSFLGIGIGCLRAGAARRWFGWFPLILFALVLGVYAFRLEVASSSPGSIYFSSGTKEPVVVIESTTLLPVIFLAVVALFVGVAERMGREMAALPPLTGYTANILGSLAGVAAFGLVSWLELPPSVWFGVAGAAAIPLLATADPGGVRPSRAGLFANSALILGAAGLAQVVAGGALWSPYYKIAVRQDGPDTVIEVNNIFHQSMAPIAEKEYFYQWPYAVFGDRLENVLILGAGSGTDVAAALAHGAKHVDAVEIDPTIIRLGRERHPDRPYRDPRVTIVNDDARHYLRRTDKKYDLVVFALIDSLTLQSGFSGVRLESYMFTEESFRAVRDRLAPNGVLVIYNYFRERWLVDRLANTAAVAFGDEPWVHVHAARAYLGVMMAGPRLRTLTRDPVVPDRVTAFGQSHDPSPAVRHVRDAGIEPATDDWPFLYLRDRHVPRHYLIVVALILAVSAVLVRWTIRGQSGRWSWQFFLLGAGFMLLETRAITQFALLWGSTWIVASIAIASVLVMALAATLTVSKIEITRPWIVGGALLALLALNFAVPVGRVTFDSRVAESVFYAALQFSPIFCAGLLFGAAIKRSASLSRDYGTNLLGAMVGGCAEYLSLLTGFQGLLVVAAVCYVGAVAARRRS
jgi:spermidine synthase